MHTFLENPEFVENRLKGNYYLFKNIQHELPTWDDVIENLNLSIENKWLVKYLDNFGFITHKAKMMRHVDSLFDYISTSASDHASKIKGLHTHVSAHCYFSLIKTSKTFGRHKDPTDVLFWQMIGKTQWTVESNNEKIIFVLEPNDLLYVPRNMWHDTKPLTARAGISFGLDYYKSIV